MAVTLFIIIVLLVVGFALVTVEALTPGVHIFGITGGLMVLGGIAYSYVKLGVMGGSITLLTSIAAFVGVVTFAIKSGAWRRMTLETEQRREQGYRSDNETLARFLGKQGTVLHDLRPVGYVEIGGERVEVVSESDFVKKGGLVEAVRVDGVRLVVRPVAAPGAQG